MPSNLATVRKQLRDAIKPLVPTRWRIIPELSAAQKLTVPALYFEFTRITSEASGAQLPPGHVFADFDLTIAAPEADVTKAENRVDAAVLDLILALDEAEGVAWSTAEKTRLETGQLAWRISLSVLTQSLRPVTAPADTPIPEDTPTP